MRIISGLIPFFVTFSSSYNFKFKMPRMTSKLKEKYFMNNVVTREMLTGDGNKKAETTTVYGKVPEN